MKIILFFLIKFGAVLSEIVLVPSNTVVTAGEKMNMKCLMTNGSLVRKWSFHNSSRSLPTIYIHGTNRFHEDFSHFGVEMNANGPVVIYVNSTRSSDAGIYTCTCEIDGKDVEYSAHLILIESLPVCESNLKNYSHSMFEGDHIWIQCSIKFRGFWTPSMEWIQHGGGLGSIGKTISDGIETMHSPSQSVTSKLTIVIDSSTNGSYYSCKIYFVNYSNTETTTANNVPNFTYTWRSKAIYASRSPTQSVFAVAPTTTEKSSSVDWNLIALPLVAALSIFFILMVTLAIARSIRFRKRVSASAMIPAKIPDVASGQQGIPSDPFYAEVPCIERAAVKSKHRTPGSSLPARHDAQNLRPLNYFGDDGTEYMEVNALGRQPMTVRIPTEPSIFNVVGEYASIDHTLSPPIPPRAKIV